MPRQRKNEWLLYLFSLLLVLALPVFFLREEQELNGSRLLLEWIRLLPFFVIFFINDLFLFPRYLIRKKYLHYVLLVTLFILVIAIAFDPTRHLKEILVPGNRPFGPDGGPLPPLRPHGPPGDKISLWGRVADRTVLSYLVVGLNIAVKLLFRRQEEERKAAEEKKIHVHTELSFLRQQVGPHFFMNTLNNIHALIHFDSVRAQESVIKLSTLMRYLLTDAQHGTATIKAEFDFLRSYIELMRLRLPDRVRVDVILEAEDPARKIPSLLFISLIENGFRHGVSYSKPSFIFIVAKAAGNTLRLEVKNTKFPAVNADKSTGLGLQNLGKQLCLLYGNGYSLEILEPEGMYHVILQIPLKYDALHSYR